MSHGSEDQPDDVTESYLFSSRLLSYGRSNSLLLNAFIPSYRRRPNHFEHLFKTEYLVRFMSLGTDATSWIGPRSKIMNSLLCMAVFSFTLANINCTGTASAWTIQRKQTIPYNRFNLVLAAVNSDWPDTGPYLAIITEPDACNTDDRTEQTISAVESALSTGHVSLISIRITRPEIMTQQEMERRIRDLTRSILALAESSNCNCKVVLSSEWYEIVDRDLSVVGIHVKESHRHLIPSMRQRLGSDVIIGTSAHSLESAIEAVTEYAPDYLFVGTCYQTASHPEKSKADLEGPALPGQVQRAVTSIPVFAIGGIDETNCHEPVLRYGAQGVAVIRAVLRSSDPAQAVIQIHNNMIRKP